MLQPYQSGNCHFWRVQYCSAPGLHL